MSEEIKVSVVVFSNRRYFQLQWVDLEGSKRTRSSGVERFGRTAREKKQLRAAAERKAELLQKDLREGVCIDADRVTWEAFKERYTLEVTDRLADSTATKVASVFALVDRHMRPRPKRLADLNASRISQWTVRLLDELGEDGKPIRTVSTVASHCRHLKAALRWGHKKELLRRVPDITPPKVPKHGKLMRGRPISFEEFERVLGCVEAALTPEPTKRVPEPSPPDPSHVTAWQEFMTGLWWSGLRLSEGLALSWNTASPVAVAFDPGYKPAFQFRPEGQKSGRAELCPMAPEFAEMLAEVPEHDRTGCVFSLPVRTHWTVCKVIAKAGKLAGVVVDQASGKTASAHDFRRAFGTRWSRRVMPAVLRQLMRHASIETTLKYYVSQEAEDVSNDLWKAYEEEQSNDLGNTTPDSPDQAMPQGTITTLPERG